MCLMPPDVQEAAPAPQAFRTASARRRQAWRAAADGRRARAGSGRRDRGRGRRRSSAGADALEPTRRPPAEGQRPREDRPPEARGRADRPASGASHAEGRGRSVEAQAVPPEPPRFTLGPREDDGVFGDYELRDRRDRRHLPAAPAGPPHLALRLRGLSRPGHLRARRAPAVAVRRGAASRRWTPAGRRARPRSGWCRARERGLQWVCGRDVPERLRDQEGLDEQQRRAAEGGHAWLQQTAERGPRAGRRAARGCAGVAAARLRSRRPGARAADRGR